MEIIALWVLCAITCSIIAHTKNRSAFGWFLVGLGFSIFGVIWIAFMKPKAVASLPR
jgi:hypothetical protein